ncbi:MAG: coproporphyrinogen dehydrogenase HemZ [Clostridium sp.]|jgi:oxygen-independent coproporphyrinogen-3 oxidase|nr:coproporphyrinogen dehydrogenase HemZ [Clostridium sp.]
MDIELNKPDFRYEMENLLRLFKAEEGRAVLFADEKIARAELKTNGKVFTEGESVIKHPCQGYAENVELAAQEITLARCLYRCLCLATDKLMPWGVLTGVRPTKLFRRLAQEHGLSAAEEYFSEQLLVSPQKIALARTIYNNQRELIAKSGPQDFSLYIGIPFCPSRCAYCSFVSHSITDAKAKKLIPDYVARLCEEIAATGTAARELNLRLQSVYMGGGTPTTLSPRQLDAVLGAVARSFDLSSCREYTVEAGRPDTVTAEKLDVIKAHGAGRVSINPQSFDDKVLRAIGRGHTSEQTLGAFRLASEFGFGINMDFIAGLPGDSPSGFAKSIERAVELAPQNITIHALAIKRAAALNDGVEREASGGEYLTPQINSLLEENGYEPYYSYRQSNSLGGLENTGFAKHNYQSAYNIYMMEEIHTVLACGSGAVTKLKAPQTGYIERVFNFKFPYEYLSRFDEILARKAAIKEFYAANVAESI